MQNEYVLKLPELDDDTILATDAAGQELLTFAVTWAGKQVRIRYPRFGQWQKFCELMYEILVKASASIDKIDMETALTNKEVWEDLCARFLFLHDIYPSIYKAFFAYLRPTVDGLSEADSRAWLTTNAPLDAVVRMFCALLTPQAMLKKNARFALNMIFQASADRPSTRLSTNNGDGAKSESMEAAPSLFGSFY